jgi:phospholipase D-like protein
MVARKQSKSAKAKVKTKKTKAKAKAKTAKTKTAKTKKAATKKTKAKKTKKTKAKKAGTRKTTTKKVKTSAKAKTGAKKVKPAKSVTKSAAKSAPAASKPAATPKPGRHKPASPLPTVTTTVGATPPAPPASIAAAQQQATPAAASPPAGSPSGFEVLGTNASAPFTLKLHRGDGMTLLGMNWKDGKPPENFVGFAIELQVPGAADFKPLTNRLNFLDANGNVVPGALPTLQAPVQKFRWVHFPQNAELAGDYNYRVTPMFMDANDKLTQGPPQQAAIQLARETYPGEANVTFTRGFVSSQAFVDHYGKDGDIKTLVAPSAAKGLDFKPTHPDTTEALAWMGFEARSAILETLDQAIAAKAPVRVIAYDFNLPEILERLEKLGSSLKIIIDDSGSHHGNSAESEGEKRLVATAGRDNVKRQHMGSLQHNKTISVGAPVNKVVFGSTNLSWRGFYVQANNAFVVTGETPFQLASAAFDAYFAVENNSVAEFDDKPSADWNDLKLPNIDAKVAFSPHSADNAKLGGIADDIKSTTSSLLYSLAFLYETPGVVRDAIKAVTDKDNVFVYGISDKHVGGLDVQDPSGNVAPVFAAQLSQDVPEPFKSEPSGGGGTRMHHKFTVIDFDKPTARVYLGSYNFSTPADRKNGENLVVVRDRRIAVSYMIEALSIFDHYSFRVAQNAAHEKGQKLYLLKPPRAAGEKPWWDDDFTVAHKIKDRILFS